MTTAITRKNTLYVHPLEPGGEARDLWTAPARGRVSGLAEDRSHLYFAFDDVDLSIPGKIFRIPKRGGQATVHAEATVCGSDLVASGGFLYYSTCSSEIHRVRLSGGPSKVIATNQRGLAGLAVLDDRVFFVAGGAHSIIRSVPLGGGEVTTHVSGRWHPRQLVAHDGDLYVLDMGLELNARTGRISRVEIVDN